MKTLLLLIHFTGISLCLSAQTIKYENAARDFSFKDTNYIYIGVLNKFHLEKEKLGIIRITSENKGISSSLYNTYFEVSPKHEGVFTLNLEAKRKGYKVLFVAKRVAEPGS
jgi:hypothetical protein